MRRKLPVIGNGVVQRAVVLQPGGLHRLLELRRVLGKLRWRHAHRHVHRLDARLVRRQLPVLWHRVVQHALLRPRRLRRWVAALRIVLQVVRRRDGVLHVLDLASAQPVVRNPVPVRRRHADHWLVQHPLLSGVLRWLLERLRRVLGQLRWRHADQNVHEDLECPMRRRLPLYRLESLQHPLVLQPAGLRRRVG